MTWAAVTGPGGTPGTWALLVAGSDGWDNYRHQADVLAQYQRLRVGRVPAGHIIVISADDLARNDQNPDPGRVPYTPGGPSLHHDAHAEGSVPGIRPQVTGECRQVRLNVHGAPFVRSARPYVTERRRVRARVPARQAGFGDSLLPGSRPPTGDRRLLAYLPCGLAPMMPGVSGVAGRSGRRGST